MFKEAKKLKLKLNIKIIPFVILQRQYNADDFKISNNLKHVLLITDIKKNFIYSRLAKYYIYERSTRLVYFLFLFQNAQFKLILHVFQNHFKKNNYLSFNNSKNLSPAAITDSRNPYRQTT